MAESFLAGFIVGSHLLTCQLAVGAQAPIAHSQSCFDRFTEHAVLGNPVYLPGANLLSPAGDGNLGALAGAQHPFLAHNDGRVGGLFVGRHQPGKLAARTGFTGRRTLPDGGEGQRQTGVEIPDFTCHMGGGWHCRWLPQPAGLPNMVWKSNSLV